MEIDIHSLATYIHPENRKVFDESFDKTGWLRCPDKTFHATTAGRSRWPGNFDVAALRSLVAGVDLGSFAKAAGRVARSSSAVSAQIRKLEEQAGTPLFVKAGRGLALTDAGDAMLRYARRMIELNDEAAAAVRA